MNATTFDVTGMTCGHCAEAVTREVAGVAGVSSVDVAVDTGTVVVHGDEVNAAAVRAAVDEAGYAVL